jgi:hypothetical protein
LQHDLRQGENLLPEYQHFHKTGNACAIPFKFVSRALRPLIHSYYNILLRFG